MGDWGKDVDAERGYRSEENGGDVLLKEGITRQQLVRRAGASALVVASGSLLAACGSDGSSTTEGSGGGSGSVGGGLRKLLDLPEGKAAGKGLTVTVGGQFGLTGPNAVFGVDQLRGAELAIEHIKAAGGPSIKLEALDIGSNDTQKGASTTRELGAAKVPAILTSQAGASGAGVAEYPKLEAFAIDSGGATKAFEGNPFFYQGRAVFVEDFMPGIIEYQKRTRPDAKRWELVIIDLGPIGEELQEQVVSAMTDAGYEVGDPIALPVTQTDFSSALSTLRQRDPDGVLEFITGQADGTFMKQYAVSGLSAPVVGFDWTPGAAKIAGSAFEDFDFCFDYFDAAKPGTAWGKLFVSEFEAKYGNPPGQYNANYYETTFLLWDLMRRIIAKGGDPTKPGELYVEAFDQNPSFPSVYGTSGAHGTNDFSTKTHSLTHRAMVYGNAGSEGEPTVLATFDSTGANFRLVS